MIDSLRFTMATQFTDSNIRFIERFVEHYIPEEKKPKQAAPPKYESSKTI